MTGFNVPAWKVMEQLAATQLTDGKWEKNGDGYVLHGKRRDLEVKLDPEKANAMKKAFADARAAISGYFSANL